MLGSVTNIGDWAFFDCINLVTATIPNSVVSMMSRNEMPSMPIT